MDSIYETGKMVFLLSPDMVPSSIPFKMDTDYFDGLLPGLVDKYGSGKPVYMFMEANSSPRVFFNQGEMGARAGMDVTFIVDDEEVIVLHF